MPGVILQCCRRLCVFSTFLFFFGDVMHTQEYGVTSEGVFVFLDEALRNRGIDPKKGQTFTLKLTGVRIEEKRREERGRENQPPAHVHFL